MCCRGDKAPPPTWYLLMRTAFFLRRASIFLSRSMSRSWSRLSITSLGFWSPRTKNKKNAECVELIVNEFEKMDVKK